MTQKYKWDDKKGMITKNSEDLESFTNYCKAHPELTFWKALQIWRGHQIFVKKCLKCENIIRLSKENNIIIEIFGGRAARIQGIKTRRVIHFKDSYKNIQCLGILKSELGGRCGRRHLISTFKEVKV